MTPPRSRAKALSAFVPKIIGETLAARGMSEASLIADWPAIVGETIAETVAEDSAPLMDGGEAGPHLDAAVAAQAIAPAERALLAAIMDGVSIAEALGANPFLRRRIKTEFNGDVSAFVEDLADRAARFAARSL